MKKILSKKAQGITLIALIITIVVLLILAGVTLNIVLNSGIINKSQTATSKYNEQATKEKLTLALTEYKFKQLAKETPVFNDIISNIGGEVTEETEAEWTIDLDGFIFTVNKTTHEITNIEPSNSTPLEAPEIATKTFTVASDTHSATIKVTATAKNGGTLTVTIDNKTATLIGSEYTVEVDSNGDKEIKVTETVGKRKIVETTTINITGIVEPTYTISYDANGGTGTMSDTTGTNPQIASNGFTAPTGKEFKEWNTASNGTGTAYNSEANLKADQTLYAIWKWQDNHIFTKGEEVTVGGEQFYVIEDGTASSTTVTLIAKYNLNQAGTAQAPNAAYVDTAVEFSNDNYWKNDWVSGTRIDLNNYEIPSSETASNNAIKKAQAYANSKETGASAKLLTYEEADSLKSESTELFNIIYGRTNKQGQNSSEYYLYYWLSSAHELSNEVLWYIDGKYPGIGNSVYSVNNIIGVRPVITVSKTLVQ